MASCKILKGSPRVFFFSSTVIKHNGNKPAGESPFQNDWQSHGSVVESSVFLSPCTGRTSVIQYCNSEMTAAVSSRTQREHNISVTAETTADNTRPEEQSVFSAKKLICCWLLWIISQNLLRVFKSPFRHCHRSITHTPLPGRIFYFKFRLHSSESVWKTKRTV